MWTYNSSAKGGGVPARWRRAPQPTTIITLQLCRASDKNDVIGALVDAVWQSKTLDSKGALFGLALVAISVADKATQLSESGGPSRVHESCRCPVRATLADKASSGEDLVEGQADNYQRKMCHVAGLEEKLKNHSRQ